MSNKWNYQPPTQEQIHKRDQLVERFGLTPIVSLLLVQRGISSEDEVKKYLNPSLRDLHDPFLLPGMEKAVHRLNRALGNKEKILIYGDYDVDGTTAVALVYKFLEQNCWKSNLDYYIPDRYDEGSGISEKGIHYAVETGVKLIIALDCGIRAIDKVAYAKTLGIDFIICDHHMPDDELPDAVAVLDPKRLDSTYPYVHLSGCGVGFKLMQAFAINNGLSFSKLKSLLDLVAVSIASDIVPITGENRILAYHGLKQLNHNPGKGLKGIIDICGLSGKDLTISDIVFKIGPRINASGRMMNGRETVDLLLSKDKDSAKEKSESIDQYNDERRELDKKITDEAHLMLELDSFFNQRKTIVVFNREWHKGVIAIVASRLSEKHYKPTIVLTFSNGFITGSARSSTGFDIYKAIESCKDLLENFGGHTYAAGLTMKEENLEEFKTRFETYAEESLVEEQLTQTLDIDIRLNFNEITDKLMDEMNRMNPFGPENQKPVFCSFHVMDSGTSKLVGKDLEHIKLDITDNQDDRILYGIAFGMHRFYDHIKDMKPFDICYTLEENTYSHNTPPHLMVKDIRIPAETSE